MSRPTDARSHRSIGEVLSLLQQEYPDVTISKIRFLESQGLLDPERTPSGYRKFYDADIKRLRWILHQQREHYLPLKVIKERLDQADDDAPSPDGAAQQETQHDGQQRLLYGGAQANGHARNGAVGSARSATNGAIRSAWSPGSPSAVSGAPESGAAEHDAEGMSIEELSEGSGIPARDIRHLERFGLIAAHELGGEQVYDGDALTVARVAARLMQHGIEARHMRTYKVAVDREASLYEQIVLPVLKQRNPEARRRAAQTVADLIDMGEVMRGALLRRELRHYLEDKD